MGKANEVEYRLTPEALAAMDWLAQNKPAWMGSGLSDRVEIFVAGMRAERKRCLKRKPAPAKRRKSNG